MSLRGDAISQAGAKKAVRPPTGLGMRRPFLRKETGERKSYAIDRPFRPARPSAARSGNGARRGRRYAPQLCSGRPPDYAKESRPGGLAHSGSPPPLLALEPWAGRPGISLLFCSCHEKDAQKRSREILRVLRPRFHRRGHLTERVRVIGSSNPAAFMSRSFNCPSETRSRSTMHGCPPSFLALVQRTVAPPTRKGINMETSLPFGSENLWRKSGFKFPETTRLYSQREYAAPKIIPSAANVATKLFLWKAPTEMGNSPIKLLVPGELILAKVEEKEMVERFGMVLTNPP
ncbi:hypothetical protein RIF29_48382 [Crotalaria pallida]|uniref:Uncharacterized protein n=1 Tax=Crotalaria pallida TaxID=3830 RepID=A0AAN9HIW8_CROPI